MAQTDGQVLTVVNGGASWANANSDGNGIYSGNGTSPADLEITVTDSIDFDDGTLFIDGSNDRIGIGTGIPSDKLTIYDRVDADLLIQVYPTSSTSSLSLQFGTNSQTTASKIESSIDWDVSNDILSLNNGGLGISIINGGDVGINTTSPTSPLHVNGAIALPSRISGANQTIDLDENDYTLYCNGAGNTIILPSADDAPNRIYRIINRTNNTQTISSYELGGGAGSSTDVPVQSVLIVQSIHLSGSNRIWIKIN